MRPLAALAISAACLSPSLAFATGWPAPDWPSAEPRAVGLDPQVLAALDADIAAGKYGYVDGMLVIRHGKLAYERYYQHDYDRAYGEEAKRHATLVAHDPSGPYNYFNPWWHPYYRRGDLHTMQSVTKTVTSIVIGIARTRGEFPELETPVLRFFDPAQVQNRDARKERITIRHLLTMTAGFEWNEDVPYADPSNSALVMEASCDWVRYAIDRPMAHEPGAVFQYNSGATQLLSHVFRAATGRDIEEYAQRYLFTPLGIERYFWKRSPGGLVDTEGGLYLHPRDLAKIGYLFLKDGLWQAERVVAADWVRESVTPAIAVNADGVQYGYKWWLYPYGADRSRLAWAGSGFGGQRPIVVPEHDLVIVFTGWNILPDRPSLSPRVALDRVLAALVPQP